MKFGLEWEGRTVWFGLTQLGLLYAAALALVTNNIDFHLRFRWR